MIVPYMSVIDGDAYFATRVEYIVWDEANPDQKHRALCTATEMMDRLNYSGVKAVDDQENEFPRKTDPTASVSCSHTPVVNTLVPVEIQRACALIAYKLLDGVDIDMEMSNMTKTHVGFAEARVAYDRGFAIEAYAHGIPSFAAWGYIKPFLREQFGFKISRVN